VARIKKEKQPAQNRVEDGGLLPCADTWCESYHDGSARNCLKEVGDFIVCPDRTRPEPTSNEVQKQEPSPELAVQECRNDVCKHYNRTFVLNCENASSGKQKLVDICNFEVNSNPVPINEAENNSRETGRCATKDCTFFDECPLVGCRDLTCRNYTSETENLEPASPAEEKHQENVAPEADKRRLKKLQICLEERDLKTVAWIDMMAAENRRDRNGQIMTMLENMMLRDMEAA